MEILPFPIIYFNLHLSPYYSIFPVTRALYIFTIIWPCYDESRCTRYSNGISHVCSLVHALVQNNPRTHIRYRINSVGSKKEEKRKKTTKCGEAGTEVVSRVGKLNLAKAACDTSAQVARNSIGRNAKHVLSRPHVHVRCDESRFSYEDELPFSSSVASLKNLLSDGFQKIRFLSLSPFLALDRNTICKFTYANLFRDRCSWSRIEFDMHSRNWIEVDRKSARDENSITTCDDFFFFF